MKDLVSIITPCYNGEKYLKKFLDTLSNQTYENIEYIFVDDGSTDNSGKIFKDWKKQNKDRFKKIMYIYQENAGQAAAINTALEHVSGKYLMWCDCDDFLYENNVELKVKTFKENPNLELVFCSCKNVDIESGKDISTFVRKRPNKYLFEDNILERNVHFCPALYMVKFSALKKCYPNLKIYDSRGGQNWQLLLPLLFRGNCKFVNKIVVDYSVRLDSHSHNLKTIENIYNRLDQHKKILLNVLSQIDMSKQCFKYYENLIEQKYYRVKMNYAIKYDDNKKASINYKFIFPKKMNVRITYALYKMRIINLLLFIRKKVRGRR